jgi:hypothetical protein
MLLGVSWASKSRLQHFDIRVTIAFRASPLSVSIYREVQVKECRIQLASEQEPSFFIPLEWRQHTSMIYCEALKIIC